jgi:hypothetical protein
VTTAHRIFVAAVGLTLASWGGFTSHDEASAGKPGGGGSTATGQIYFTMDDGPNDAIWRIDDNGSGKVQVLPTGVFGVPSSRVYGDSRWWLTFGADPVTGATEIFSFRDDGSPPVQLTAVGPAIGFVGPAVTDPRWSNDGQDTFVSVHGYATINGVEGANLFRLPIVGDIGAMQDLGLLPLTPADCEVILPPRGNPYHLPAYSWSPHASTLAYIEQYDDSGNTIDRTIRVRVLPVDPGDLVIDVPIYTHEDLIGGPVWSPDGSRIAFNTSNSSAWGGVWTVRPDGTGAVQVLRNSGTMSYGCSHWSPNSQHLLLRTVKARLGDWYYHIARMPAGGGTPTVLTKDLPQEASKWTLGWFPLSP